MMLRSRIACFVFTLLAPAALLAAADLPNFDAVAQAPVAERAPGRIAALQAVTPSPMRTEWHSRYGVPSFVWFGDGASDTVRTASSAARFTEPVETTARRYVWDNASLYGLGFSDVSSAWVSATHDTGRGAIVVKFRQRIDGIDVFREELNVVMNRRRELIAMSGSLPAGGTAVASSSGPRASAHMAALGAQDAIAAALTDLAPAAALSANDFVGAESAGGFTTWSVPQPASASALVNPTRTKAVWFRLPDHLERAWYVELDVASTESTDSSMYAYVVSATDGRLLFRKNLTEEEAAPTPVSYRVWADPNGVHRPLNGPQGFSGFPNPTGLNDGYQAPFIAPAVLSLAYGPISTKDRWLPEGATETLGNNADAYVDLSSPDGRSSGDFRASASGPNAFDYTYDVDSSPVTSKPQQMAAITQLFYTVNFLHDWFYDSGFNEAAGNAQQSNYGRGGLEGDPLRAESQDYSGRNNANMSTPPDGSRPRMQMFLFDARPGRALSVDKPSGLVGEYAVSYALFGPQSFTISGDVTKTVPADGCTALTGDVSGKIVMIDRGGCTFPEKAQNAQNAGAIGVIVVNVTTPDTSVIMGCNTTPCTAAEMTLPPALMMKSSDASRLKLLLLANGSFHATMRRESAVDRDGSIDNAIVAHEWGHYLSNRLIGDGLGIGSRQSRGMGEGWSDFVAMLMMVRPEDTSVASNATFNGVYPSASYALSGGGNGSQVNTAYYYGIRRLPYSTSMSINSLTLKHIATGNIITGVVPAFGGDGTNNAEVHNTGEVWATMLWECYAALLRDTQGSNPRLTFAEAQKRMKDYLVGALRATPIEPTFMEARDALLAVAAAGDAADYQTFFKAFAKRGAGLRASAGERYSIENFGVVEDFNIGGDVVLDDAQLEESSTNCNKDGQLDAGETGIATISIRNSGNVRLQSTTARLSSSDSRVTFDNDGVVSFPASDPQQVVSAPVHVTVGSASEVLLPTFTMTIKDPALSFPEVTVTLPLRLNAHDQAKWSTSDDVESSGTAWKVTSPPVGTSPSIPLWNRIETGLRDHEWWGDERYSKNDSSLESPTLLVSDTEPLVITFRHRYGFDNANDTSGKPVSIDGGVVEITSDGGATWTDIGVNASPGYGTVPIFKGNGNPLEGRNAFVGFSSGASLVRPGNGEYIATKIDLGTAYAGKSVRVRFRIGCGTNHNNELLLGWEVDDIVFKGLRNTPFYALVPSSGICGVDSSSTTLTLPSAFDPAQPVHMEAVVSSRLGTPTGTVEFLDNGQVLGTVKLSNGTASLDVRLASGTHTLVASYAGTMNFQPSTATATFGGPPPPVPPRRRAVGH